MPRRCPPRGWDLHKSDRGFRGRLSRQCCHPFPEAAVIQFHGASDPAHPVLHRERDSGVPERVRRERELTILRLPPFLDLLLQPIHRWWQRFLFRKCHGPSLGPMRLPAISQGFHARLPSSHVGLGHGSISILLRTATGATRGGRLGLATDSDSTDVGFHRLCSTFSKEILWSSVPKGRQTLRSIPSECLCYRPGPGKHCIYDLGNILILSSQLRGGL